MIQGEAMVDPCRQDDHVTWHHLHADPFVIGVTHVKVTAALHAKPNLLIRVNVLRKEVLQLQEKRWKMFQLQEQRCETHQLQD